MKQAPEVRFIGMEPSEALASAVLERAARLDRCHPSIMSCRATVELSHKPSRQGRSIAGRLAVGLPGYGLTVSRVEHEDACVALRHAFDDIKRQLEEKARRLQEPRDERPPQRTESEPGGSPP